MKLNCLFFIAYSDQLKFKLPEGQTDFLGRGLPEKKRRSFGWYWNGLINLKAEIEQVISYR